VSEFSISVERWLALVGNLLETLKRNPLYVALLTLAGFVLWQAPIGILQAWSGLDHKTLPEWLAANGLPRLRYLLLGWYGLFVALFVVALVFLVRTARRGAGNSAGEVTGELMERLRIAEMNAASAGQLASVAHSAATSVATRINNYQTEPADTSLQLTVSIVEAFVIPNKDRTADCFLRVSVHNHTKVECANPLQYTLSLKINDQEGGVPFLVESFWVAD
jgi:hypothetical protein